MSDKYCCCTWLDLSAELAESKAQELVDLIQTKGIPRSIFAPVYRVLENIANFCPVCGSSLKASVATTPVPQKGLVEPPNVPIKNLAPRICRACGGRKTLGTDKNGVVIKCLTCHGEGIFNRDNHDALDSKDSSLVAEALDKVANLRNTKGIGDNTVNAE